MHVHVNCDEGEAKFWLEQNPTTRHHLDVPACSTLHPPLDGEGGVERSETPGGVKSLEFHLIRFSSLLPPPLTPPHVHAEHGYAMTGRGMRCDSVRSANALEPEIELAYNHKLTRKQLREAE